MQIVVKQVTPSTVIVKSDLGRAPAAGWVLDADQGLIVTNFHVVNGGDAFR